MRVHVATPKGSPPAPRPRLDLTADSAYPSVRLHTNLQVSTGRSDILRHTMTCQSFPKPNCGVRHGVLRELRGQTRTAGARLPTAGCRLTGNNTSAVHQGTAAAQVSAPVEPSACVPASGAP